MSYQIPKSKARLKKNRFEFQFPDDPKKYSVPLLQYVRPGLAIEFDSMSDEQACHALLDEYYPDENLFDRFEDAEQFIEFLQAWQEASKVTTGESEASSGS